MLELKLLNSFYFYFFLCPFGHRPTSHTCNIYLSIFFLKIKLYYQKSKCCALFCSGKSSKTSSSGLWNHTWLPGSLPDFLSRDEERMAWRTHLVISFMSSLKLAEISPISRPWKAEEDVIPSTTLPAELPTPLLTTTGIECAMQPLLLSSSSLCCLDSELSHCSYEDE